MNLTQEQVRVLRHIAMTGGTGNVMEALNWGPSHFERGFELANAMQNLDLVKLLYSNFNKNLIVVEATLLADNFSRLE